jgi:hypothetical protein
VDTGILRTTQSYCCCCCFLLLLATCILVTSQSPRSRNVFVPHMPDVLGPHSLRSPRHPSLAPLSSPTPPSSLHSFVGLRPPRPLRSPAPPTGLAGFALGATLVRCALSRFRHILLGCLFACATPVGIFAGDLVVRSLGGCNNGTSGTGGANGTATNGTHNGTSSPPSPGGAGGVNNRVGAAVSLQAIKGAAAGTFLYIALVEILARELKHDDHESGGGARRRVRGGARRRQHRHRTGEVREIVFVRHGVRSHVVARYMGVAIDCRSEDVALCATYVSLGYRIPVNVPMVKGCHTYLDMVLGQRDREEGESARAWL